MVGNVMCTVVLIGCHRRVHRLFRRIAAGVCVSGSYLSDAPGMMTDPREAGACGNINGQGGFAPLSGQKWHAHSDHWPSLASSN